MKITYGETTYEVEENETVLDCLLRNGENPEYGCKNGVCHACVLEGEGEVPEAATKGLNAEQLANKQFLSCQCYPTAELTIAKHDRIWKCEIQETLHPTDDIVIHRVRKPSDFNYKAGQFVSIHNKDVSRPYSLASSPDEKILEFHIRVLEGGQLSPWLYSWPEPGMRLNVGEPTGACHYSQCEKDLVLAGTGTGLAPLYGILKDALAQGHSKSITLLHGGRVFKDLYLHETLTKLAEENELITYVPALTQEEVEGIESGRLNKCIAEKIQDPQAKQFFLCGNPDFVDQTRAELLEKGVEAESILADAFSHKVVEP